MNNVVYYLTHAQTAYDNTMNVVTLWGVAGEYRHGT